MFSLTLASILALCFQLNSFDKQYQDFISEENKAKHLFDSLDYLVYQSLPIPNEVYEVEHYSIGMEKGYHGRTLVVHYQTSDGSLENVFSLYDQFLLSDGWEKYYEDSADLESHYNKEKACIHFSATRRTNQYWIEIYHDYFDQDGFKPKLPSSPWAIVLNEPNGTSFAGCPYGHPLEYYFALPK